MNERKLEVANLRMMISEFEEAFSITSKSLNVPLMMLTWAYLSENSWVVDLERADISRSGKWEMILVKTLPPM